MKTGQYFIEKSATHYTVYYTQFGCNAEIVETFNTKRQAMQYIDKMYNKEK